MYIFVYYEPNKYSGRDVSPPYKTRDEFLESYEGDYLLKTMCEMDMVVYQKCFNSPNPIKAVNSVITEWLVRHPEFEEIIAKESRREYLQMKNNEDFIGFVALLHDVELVWENTPKPKFGHHEKIIYKDDSHRMFPDFEKIDDIYEKYGSSLLAAYLSYLV